MAEFSYGEESVTYNFVDVREWWIKGLGSYRGYLASGLFFAIGMSLFSSKLYEPPTPFTPPSTTLYTHFWNVCYLGGLGTPVLFIGIFLVFPESLHEPPARLTPPIDRPLETKAA